MDTGPLSAALGVEGNRLRITVSGRQFPDAEDFDDGNWLHASASVSAASSMEARVAHAWIRAEEIEEFASDLETVHDTLTGEARFETLESWLRIRVRCDPDGTLLVTGRIRDRPAGRNRLRFELRGLDQTFLPDLIAELHAMTRAFPVVGSRP